MILKPACPLPNASVRLERRGVLWVAASFLICPCHLPITLSFLGTLLGGTALGAALHQFPAFAGIVITVAWGFGTWRGFALMHRAARYAQAVSSQA